VIAGAIGAGDGDGVGAGGEGREDVVAGGVGGDGGDLDVEAIEDGECGAWKGG